MYEKYFKRLLDIVVSFVSITVLLPVYLIIGVLVYLNMGRPIIFMQERIGKDEKKFVMYKFRTMKNTNKIVGNIDDDHKRLTHFGILLRSTSLDELPEIFNVLKGDMSLVGPRPMPSYYMPYYTKEERKRHRVMGGLIPCDAMSEEGVDISWDEQFRVELEYVDRVSFFLDVMIILKTIRILFQRITSNYGKIERPLLNEIRAGMNQQKED